MADIKWIKLATGLPDNRKIKQIRRLPEGDTIALMWVFLMCLAGETNDEGMVYFTPEIPFTDEMLSDQFGIDINTIRLGLTTFQRFGMIQVVDNIICLSHWEKWQAVDGLATIREQTRKRVARHREKQRALIANTPCQYCGGVATGYDHILAIARGGTDTEENKVPCCSECNRIKNDKPLVDFLNYNRERINDDLVLNNANLQRFVTLCNVTGRYKVTQGNATDIDKEEDKNKEKIEDIYIQIIGTLNAQAGTKYKPTTAKTKSCIHARLQEGFTLEDFFTVISKKCAEWLGTEYEKYLRPETLFGTKFESYLNAKAGKPKPSPANPQEKRSEYNDFMAQLAAMRE